MDPEGAEERKGSAEWFHVWKLLVKNELSVSNGRVSLSPWCLHVNPQKLPLPWDISSRGWNCEWVFFVLLVYLFYFHVVSSYCSYLEGVLHFCTFSLLISDDYTLHGPVFIQEPSHVMFPLDSEEKRVKLNCEVKGNPRPHIRFVVF